MIGRLLRSVRAGDTHLAWNHLALREVPAVICVSIPEFEPREPIPARFAGRGVGDNVSPPLAWTGIPDGAVELALIVEDPSVPLPRPFVHAVVAGIPPAWTDLHEGAIAERGPVRLGKTTIGKREYAGPRPVSGHGPHSYVFQLFAAESPLDLSASFAKRDLLAALAGRTVAKGRLNGTYER